MKQIDTIVLVRDIVASKTFYTEVMLLEILFDWGSMVVFKNRLALHQIDLLEPKELMESIVNASAVGSGNLIIYLGTSNIAAEFTRMQSLGVQFIHDILDLPWQKIFRLKDIDGYIVEIGEERDT